MTAKPGTKSRWTIAEIEQVKAMLDRRLSQAEIAKAMAASQASISRLAARIRESGQAVNARVPACDAISADPDAWLRQQPDMLTALIRIGQADWHETSKRDAALAAYRAEKARREQ
jgi:DNA-binding transcriptional regulator LsrR (DeoR family)